MYTGPPLCSKGFAFLWGVCIYICIYTCILFVFVFVQCVGVIYIGRCISLRCYAAGGRTTTVRNCNPGYLTWIDTTISYCDWPGSTQWYHIVIGTALMKGNIFYRHLNVTYTSLLDRWCLGKLNTRVIVREGENSKHSIKNLWLLELNLYDSVYNQREAWEVIATHGAHERHNIL